MSILERLEQMERRMAEMTGSQQHKQGSSGGGSGSGSGSGAGGGQAQVGPTAAAASVCSVFHVCTRHLFPVSFLLL